MRKKPMVDLIKMTQEEYDAYFPSALESLTNELGKARDWPRSKALHAAQKSFDGLFPDGKINVVGQHIFNVVFKGVTVGFLHVGLKEDGFRSEVFIWDIEIKPDYRGRGYGEATMRELEVFVRKTGMSRIGLNVFGHNSTAINLYKKLNYTISSMTMTKAI